MAFTRAVGGLLIAVLLTGTPLAAQAPRPARPSADTYTHVIVPGDTLIALSATLLARPREWRPIARLNRVRNPRRLMPGRTLAFPIDLMRSLPGQADVLWVRGQPRIEPAGGGTPVLALLGATVLPGATIVTGDDDAIRLRLSTGSDLTLGARARVTLVELRTLAGAAVKRTLVDVQRGRVETTVSPSTHPAQRHQIRTPVVTTTVRGTEFRVAVDDDATASAEVTDGTVGLLRDAEDVALPAGFGARVRSGVPLPAPSRLLAAPDLAGLVVAGARLPVRVRWPAVDGATGYRVRLLPAGDGPPLTEQVVSAPDTSWVDLADGTYAVVIRAIGAEGLEGLDARASLTVDARPVPPLVQGGAASAPVYGDALPLQWTRPDGVTAFDVQVASDETFATPVFERTGLTDTQVNAALPPGTYLWRLASRTAEERGPWGDAVRAELRARPAAGPPPSAQMQARELTLGWSAGLPGDRYRVQLSSAPEFTAPLLVDTVVTDPSLTIPRPARGRYHVRVAIVNAEGIEGPYGPTQTLDVPKPPRSKWWWLLLPIGAAGALVAAL